MNDWRIEEERANRADAARAIPSWTTGAPVVLRSGVAKIVTNPGSGAYTITEQWYSSASSAWTDAISPLGLVSQTAREYQSRTTGVVDDYVRFWAQRQKNGTLEYLIDVGGAQAGTAVNYLDLLPSSLEGPEQPQGDTWDRDNQGSHDGVRMKITMRPVYYDAGLQTLFGFYRFFTFDSAGILKTVGQEYRYEIDKPGVCP